MICSRRLSAPVALGLALLGILGCGRAVDDRVALRLHLPSDRGCRPTVLEALRLVALGDFGASDGRVVEANPSEAIAIERFPARTEAVSALARGGSWEGFAVASIDERARAEGRDALLLPTATPCSSPDPEARAPRGASVVELSDGSLVVVGGLDELGRATRRVVRLGAGLEIAAIEPRMPLNTVAFGTATSLGDGTLLIAGGASGEPGEVRDTFEVLRLDGDSAVRRAGALTGPRRDHSALRLAGEVILVGGSDGTRALDTIERIDVTTLTSTPARARLLRARRSPTVVFRADGSLVVAGGTDDAGSVASIEVVDPGLTVGAEVALDPALPPARYVVALTGPRLLWVGAADASGVSETFVVTLDGAPRVTSLGALAPILDEAVAVALTDGRALVVGRRGLTLRADVVDVSAMRVEPQPPSREPGALHALADGVVIELDDVGATFRRHTRVSPLDPPPASWRLPADVGSLALDAGVRWSSDVGRDPALVAEEAGARLDVPVLRLARLRLTVRVSGDAEVLLLDDGGPVASIALRGDVSIGDCRAPRPADEVTIVREGDHIDIGGVACTVPGLPARVGAAVRAASAGMRLRVVALERLE